MSCLSPWRDGTGWNRVKRSSSLHALTRTAPRRESKGGFGPLRVCKYVIRQCANTLGGSDTTHPAASSR